MKKKLLVVVVLNLVLCAALPWVYRWGMAKLLGPDIFMVPFDKTLEPDPHLFPDADAVDYSGLTFVVPSGTTVQLGPRFSETAAGRFQWDSVSVIFCVETDSVVVQHLAIATEKAMYAQWHPGYLTIKAMTLAPSFKELAHIRTPFTEGYAWIETSKGRFDSYHYRLTDGQSRLMLIFKAKQGLDVSKSIENVVASIRPIEQKPER